MATLIDNLKQEWRMAKDYGIWFWIKTNWGWHTKTKHKLKRQDPALFDDKF